MSEFRAVRDNPFARNVLNIYKDDQPWAIGEVLPNGMVNLPAFDAKGGQHTTVVTDVVKANIHLNKYQGLTKGAAREYLRVK